MNRLGNFIRNAPLSAAFASVIAFAVVAGLNFAYLALHWGEVGELSSYYWGVQDFRDAIYYPCRAVLDGVNPYDPMAYEAHFRGRTGNIFPLYSPFTLLIHLPLALLPFHYAAVLYQCIQVGLLYACCWLSLRWCKVESNFAATFFLAALVLASEPGRTNLNWGQPTWLLVLGSYWALGWASHRPAWSGGGLALASFKPTYLLTLAFFMFCRGSFRALALGIVATAAVALLGFGLMSTRDINVARMPEIATANQAAFDAKPAALPSTSGARVDVTVFLAKTLGVADDSRLMLVVPAVLLAITGWIVWCEARSPENDDPASFSMFMICLGSVLGIFHMVYDLLLLTLPFVALFTTKHPSWQRFSTRGLWVLRAGAIVLIVNVLWTGPAQKIAKIVAAQGPGMPSYASDYAWHFATLLNATVLTAMWLLAVGLWLSARRPLSSPEAAA